MGTSITVYAFYVRTDADGRERRSGSFHHAETARGLRGVLASVRRRDGFVRAVVTGDASTIAASYIEAADVRIVDAETAAAAWRGLAGGLA